MPEYNNIEKNLADAAAFRHGVHKEALEKVRKTHPEIDAVIDRNPVDAYFKNVWDYPGQWYLYVSIPEGYASRDEMVDAIVKDTLAHFFY